MPTMHTLEDYSDLIKSYIDAKDSAKADVSSLGTAAAKDVPSSGNASTTQVVMGNDTRLSDSRNAADVSAWAKASTKPTYNGSEIKTNAAKTGTAQSSITNTIAASTTMDNAVGTLLNNDKTLDTNLASVKETLTNELHDNINLCGTKNFYKCNLNAMTWHDITVTKNGENDYTFNGTSSNTGTIFFANTAGAFTLKSGSYKPVLVVVSGTFATNNKGNATFTTQPVGTSTQYYKALLASAGTLVVDPFTVSDETQQYKGGIWYPTGVTFNNYRMKIMLVPASCTDYTFEPPAKTNRELTELTKVSTKDYISTTYGIGFALTKVGRVITAQVIGDVIQAIAKNTTVYTLPEEARPYNYGLFFWITDQNTIDSSSDQSVQLLTKGFINANGKVSTGAIANGVKARSQIFSYIAANDTPLS